MGRESVIPSIFVQIIQARTQGGFGGFGGFDRTPLEA